MDIGVPFGFERYDDFPFVTVGSEGGANVEDVFGVVVAQTVVKLGHADQARQECLEVFRCVCPLYFGQCVHTRQYHVFDLAECRDIFCPEVRLHADHIFPVFFRYSGSRFERIDAFQRQITADGKRVVFRVGRLVIVEIEVRVGRHDHIMFLFGSFDTAVYATPAHHRCVRSQSAFQDFVPTDDMPSFAFDEFLHAFDDIALQAFFGRVLVVPFETFRLDAGLALRATFPTHFRAFVTAYMYIFGREEVDHLAEHVFEEDHGFFVTGTDHLVRNAPLCPHFVRSARTTQFGVGRDGCQLVSRKVYFGDDRNETFLGISDHVANFVLRVEHAFAIRLAVIFAGVAADDCLPALCPYPGQFRIFLDLDTPSLVVRQMPMETVHVVQGKNVDKLLDRVGREEMAGNIEVHAAIRETRIVVDADSRKFDGHTFGHGGERFAQGLHAIENAGVGCSGDLDAVLADQQAVAFRVPDVGSDRQMNAFVCVSCAHFRFIARGLFDVGGEETGSLFHLRITFLIRDRGRRF